MAIKINYDKCYEDNTGNIGKNNIIKSVTINIDTLKSETDPTEHSIERQLTTQNFSYSAYDNSSITDTFTSVQHRQRSFYYTTLTISLPYNNYPDLKTTDSISISDSNIKYKGEKSYWYKQENNFYNTYMLSDYVYKNESIFKENINSLTDVVKTEIVYSNPSSNQIDSETAYKEYTEKYKFNESYVQEKDGATPYSYAEQNIELLSFEKKDTYAIIKIRLLSKLQIGTLGGFFNFFEECVQYSFTGVKINLVLRQMKISTESTQTVYGDNDKIYNFSPNSFLFVKGNTLFGEDFSTYYANETLLNYGGGKKLITLTLPVGEYNDDENANDLLYEGEECVIVDSDGNSRYFDSDGYEQKFIVSNTAVDNDGESLQTITAESIISTPFNSLFNHENNILTSIKEDAIPTMLIADLPNSMGEYVITKIGDNFAENNGIIEKINIPFTIIEIGEKAFAYTTGIRTPIIFQKGLAKIGRQAFDHSNINGDLEIPEGVTEIGDYAFLGCDKVTGTLYIPSTFKFGYAICKDKDNNIINNNDAIDIVKEYASSQNPEIDVSEYTDKQLLDLGESKDLFSVEYNKYISEFSGMTNLSKIIIYTDELYVEPIPPLEDNPDLGGLSNTGSCDIYVLDSMVDIFKAFMPSETSQKDRIKSISTLSE